MPRDAEEPRPDLERAMDIKGQHFVKPSQEAIDLAGHTADDFEPIPSIRDIEYADVDDVEEKPLTYAEQIGDRTDVYRGPSTRAMMRAQNRKRFGW